jgi:serine/threonine protein kinase
MSEFIEESGAHDQLVEDYISRLRNGEDPDIEEYIARCPHEAARLRGLLATVRHLQLAAAALMKTESRPAEPQPGVQLDDFRLVREIGRGGMGIVYEAIQSSLGRQVALKVLAPERAHNPVLVERFRREARAVAGLHHTNIVQVYGVGQAGETSYFAMQLISGQGLDQVLEELRAMRAANALSADGLVDCERDRLYAGPSLISTAAVVDDEPTPASGVSKGPGTEEPARADIGRRRDAGSTRQFVSPCTGAQSARRIAKLGLQVAEGLAYAHGRGVLHRDIKPSNLLLHVDGTVWITDFGLAKAQDSDELTESGDVIGTLRYMAPERFAGQSLPQGDIYSLGLTLYEMLTLEQPWRAADRGQFLDKLMHEEIVSPRKIASQIPRDLETIVLKAIAKRPRDRFASAAEMAADLRRFLNDEPILSRPLNPAQRILRWSQRNPGMASLAAAVLMLLSALTVGSTYAALRISAASSLANEKMIAEAEQRALAEQRLRDAEAAQLQAKAAAETAAQKARTANAISEFLSDMFRVSNPLSRAEQYQSPWIAAATGGANLSARDLLDRGAARLKTEIADQPDLKAELLMVIGDAYARAGERERAREVFQFALSVCREAHSGPHRLTALMLGWLGIVGPEEEQVAASRASLAMWAQLPGDEASMFHALEMTTLGGHLQRRHQDQEAEQMLRDGIGLLEAQPGSFHFNGDRILPLAFLLERQGRDEEALEIKRRAVDISKSNVGNGHPATLYSQAVLVDHLRKKKAFAEALQVQREQIDGVRLGVGQSTELAEAIVRACDVALDSRSSAEAEHFARELLHLAPSVPEHSFSWRATAAVRLGNSLVQQKRGTEADRWAGPICAWRLEEAAARHPQASVLSRAVRKHALARDTQTAKALSQDLLEMARSNKEPFLTFLAIDTIGQAPDLIDHPAELLPLFDEAYDKVKDQTHWLVLKGAAHYRAGQFDKAAAVLGPACFVLEATHHVTAYEQFFLAMAMARLNKPKEAQQRLDKGLRWLALNAPPPPVDEQASAADGPAPLADPDLARSLASDTLGYWDGLHLLAREAQRTVKEAGPAPAEASDAQPPKST